MAYRRRRHCITSTRCTYLYLTSGLLSDGPPLSSNAAIDPPGCNIIIIDFTNLLTRGEW